MKETDGLFTSNMHAGKCKCKETSKHMSNRFYTIYSYYPRKVWGKAKEGYDGRKVLNLTCNVCGATWRDYNPNSGYWLIINDNPYTGEEKLYSKRKLRILDRIIYYVKEKFNGKT